jgi:hypothetical protein
VTPDRRAATRTRRSRLSLRSDPIQKKGGRFTMRPKPALLPAVLVLIVATSVALVVGQAARPLPIGAADAPPRARLRTVHDFGAVGDGKADDTAAIQAAVDARIGEVRLPRGTYRITRPIAIDLDEVGWTSLSGGGVARIVMAGAGPAVRFVGTHEGTASPRSVRPNVYARQRMPAVEGVEFVGAHERAGAIQATGTMKLTVTRVVVRECLHAIHLVERNRNVIVSDCHLYHNRGVGVYLDDVNLHQINVTGSHVSYNAGGGIVVRAGNVRNLQVSGCDIEGNMGPAGAPATANILIDGRGGDAGTAEVAIAGCTIQHTAAATGSANIRFVGADAKDRRWGHLTIADNVLSDVQTNIDIEKARGAIITGNTMWQAVQHNLRVRDSSNVVVGPNLADRNPQYWRQDRAGEGLVFESCRDCTITGLHVNGVRQAGAGLILRNCRRMNVSNCTVLDCQTAGMLLADVSDSRVSGCLIRNDRAEAEAWRSLRAIGGRGNVIAGNVFGGPADIDAKCLLDPNATNWTAPQPSREPRGASERGR